VQAPATNAPIVQGSTGLTEEQKAQIAQRKAQALAKLADKQKEKEIQRREEELMLALEREEGVTSQASESFQTPETSQEQSFNSSGVSQITGTRDFSLWLVLNSFLPMCFFFAAAPPPVPEPAAGEVVPQTVDLPETLQYD